jgi:hypothetical protein
MYTKFIKPLGLLLLLASTGLFTSCQKEDAVSDVENFVLQSVYEIEERCGAGMAGCYELVFPVTLQFADSTTQEVADYDALKQAIREWYQANTVRPRPWNRPTLVLPIDVINSDGEVITVETPAELIELRRACVNDTFGPGHGNHHGKDRACFKPVFPFTIQFPDSTQATVTNPQEFKQAIRTWKANNPGVPGHPVFVFPITVTLRDGTQVVVNSKEELDAIKEECRG